MSKSLEAARKALAEKGRSVRKRENMLDHPKVQDRILELEKRAPSAVNNYARAMSGESRTAAMKAFCLECVCWVRSEIRLCTSPACPLYPYRPFQSGDDENVDSEEGEGTA